MGEELDLNPYSPYWLYNNLMFLFPRVNYNPDDYYERQQKLQKRQAMATGLSNFGTTLGSFIGQKTGLNTSNSGGSSNGSSSEENDIKRKKWKDLTKKERAGEAGLYMSMAGQLGEAVFGSNDYSGEKGNITSSMDAGYDAAKQVASQLGPWGKMAAGIMDINAGLGNAFGQTDKTNKIDAAFDSKMTPFFLKWINSSGAKTVRSGLSAQEDDRLQAFNQDAYGDTGFDMIGKKVGRFAKKYYNRFLNKVNKYTNSMLAMANQAELQGIRSQGMASENALNYYQEISGGMDLVERGSKGMKITKSLIERFRNVRSKVQLFRKGGETAKHWYFPKNWTEEKIPYSEWIKDVNPDYVGENYDLESAYKYLPKEDLERWKWAVNSPNPYFYMNYKKDGKYIYHLGSIADLGNGDFMFLKKGKEDTNPELHHETDEYWNGLNGLINTHDLVFEKDRYYYRKKNKSSSYTPVFKKGGHLSRQMNVIPEGALHAHKNHMEGAGEDFTSKGIPVVTNDKEAKQTAEIEREEIIFTKNVTDKIERWYKEFYNENTSSSDKDELAIKCGKFLVNEILFNTDDRVGLIRKIEEKDGN